MHIPNGDVWAAAFLASEPDYTLTGWIEAYKRAFSSCSPARAGHRSCASRIRCECMWNNPKVAAGLDAVFGPAPR